MKTVEVKFQEVDLTYVAERLSYNEMFDSFFYLNDGDLCLIKDFKDFTEVVANQLPIYEQSEKSYDE